MTTSIILTINNRTPEVSKKVAESLRLPGNEADEVIVVLDRAAEDVKGGALEAYMPLPTRFVYVDGPPGWMGPARAWNRGFDQAAGDLFYCLSSEVVQDAGNVKKAKKACEGDRTVVFGACHNSEPANLVVGAEPGLLVSSKMPRPLGFIVCMPSWAVKQIGGFDENFMRGFWYDDDDFFLRMWRTGVDFVFDDAIHGVHLHHERPTLESERGRFGITANADYMIRKHGKLHPWSTVRMRTEFGDGRLTWRHSERVPDVNQSRVAWD